MTGCDEERLHAHDSPVLLALPLQPRCLGEGPKGLRAKRDGHRVSALEKLLPAMCHISSQAGIREAIFEHWRTFSPLHCMAP